MYSLKKVLIVDDFPLNLKILVKLMEKIGFLKNNLSFAKNGSEALYILHHDTIDLVISDYQMPIMDGLTLLKEIKNDTILYTIPVILNSGTFTEELIDQATLFGAIGFFPKPFLLHEISDQIKKAFPS